MDFGGQRFSSRVEDTRRQAVNDPLSALLMGYDSPASMVSDQAYGMQSVPTAGPTVASAFGLTMPGNSAPMGAAPYSGTAYLPFQSALGRLMQTNHAPQWLLANDGPKTWSGNYRLGAEDFE